MILTIGCLIIFDQFY